MTRVLPAVLHRSESDGRRLVPVATLAGRPRSALGTRVLDRLATTGLANVFNPSVLTEGGRTHLAFRALAPDGGKPFRAYYCVDDGTAGELVDLSAAVADHLPVKVADPKLFAHGGAVHVTFNTGTPQTGPNEVYVMTVHPQLGPPVVCRLPVRTRIEKNWAFFTSAVGLSALYSLDPLTVVDVDDDRPLAAGGGELRLRPRAGGGGPQRPRPLTLGTPPLRRADDASLLLVAHEKFVARGRRAYVGRPVVVSGVDTANPALTVAPVRLVHSWRAVRPRLRPAHNPNLWSATYFAGLVADGRDFLATYGVNDVAAGAATLEASTWTG